MNRRFDQLKRRYATWMLAAIFAWVMQPVGTSLFCHNDFSRDHSAHASQTQHFGHQHGNGEVHDHAVPHIHAALHDHADSHHEATTRAQQGASGESPRPAHEACCCEPHSMPVATVAASHSWSNDKAGIVSPPVAVLAVVYEPETPITVASRAGPDVPRLFSQLRRSSSSNRAPPFSA